MESYSRRLGTQLGLFITEPYRGDYLVKLKANRKHSTDEVIAEFRHEFNRQIPAVRWEFPGILTDLVGDLALTPEPIEIKVFSPDLTWLRTIAPQIESRYRRSVPGVVDTFSGLTETGPSINVRVRPADAQRFGLTASDIAAAANTAMLGQISSHVLEGDRIVNIRVLANPKDRGHHGHAARPAHPHARAAPSCGSARWPTSCRSQARWSWTVRICGRRWPSPRGSKGAIWAAR